MIFIINTDTSLIMTLNWEQLLLQITLEERSVWLYLPWKRSDIDWYGISFGIHILLERSHYFFNITRSSPSWYPSISSSSSMTLLQYLTYYNSTSSLTFVCTSLTQLQLAKALRKGPYQTNLLLAGFDANEGKYGFATFLWYNSYEVHDPRLSLINNDVVTLSTVMSWHAV